MKTEFKLGDKVVEEATVTLKISELSELLIRARKYNLYDDDYTNAYIVFDKDVDQIIREVESKHIMNMNIS